MFVSSSVSQQALLQTKMDVFVLHDALIHHSTINTGIPGQADVKRTVVRELGETIPLIFV